MKILHFSHYGSNAGGVERYVADVSATLTAAGHTSLLLSFAAENTSQLMPGTVAVGAVRTKPALASIEREMVDFHPDVAYIHAVYEPKIVEWIADRLPTVAYVHGSYLVCPGFAQFLRRSGRICPYAAGPGCLLRAQTERCCFGRSPLRHWQRLQQVHAFIAIYQRLNILVGSCFMRELLQRNHLGKVRTNVLAPFLIETPLPELTTITNNSTIAYAGRLTPDKGLPHLIRALSNIPQAWRLLVAGDGAGRADCERLAAQLGVGERISFLGWLSGPKLAQFYRDSSFLVVPSHLPESFGRVGPEAATYGRAAVAYNVGGVADWLVDGVTGYLVPPGDISLLREQIENLLDAPARQIELGRQAQELAFARWSSAEHVVRLIGYLQAAQEQKR